MCLSIPSKVIEIDENNVATVETLGVTRKVSLDLISEEVKVGEYVLIHVGYAMQKITLSILASLQASSMRLFGITQTGQPGPWTKFICPPTKLGSANFIMLCV